MSVRSRSGQRQSRKPRHSSAAVAATVVAAKRQDAAVCASSVLAAPLFSTAATLDQNDVEAVDRFDRVLIVDRGRIIEDGKPEQLFRSPSSRLSALIAQMEELRTTKWDDRSWRRVSLRSGRLHANQ